MAKYLKCPNKNCRYSWDYNGNSKFQACCPRCGWKVRINSMEIPRPKTKKGVSK